MRLANSVPNAKIGVDLGLETLAALSDGRAIEQGAEVLPQERGAAGNGATGEEDAQAHLYKDACA
jgi:hypothetical protein